MFQPGGKELSREELLENARENTIKMKKIFGDEVFICAENNNYFPTPAYKWITDADFIFELITEKQYPYAF